MAMISRPWRSDPLAASASVSSTSAETKAATLTTAELLVSRRMVSGVCVMAGREGG